MVKIIQILAKLTYMDLNTFFARLHCQTVSFLSLLFSVSGKEELNRDQDM